MNTAEIIYQRVQTLPDKDIEKILLFIDSLSKKTSINKKASKKLNEIQKHELQMMMSIAHQCASLPDINKQSIEQILGYGMNGFCE
jgi:hypothetical protein